MGGDKYHVEISAPEPKRLSGIEVSTHAGRDVLAGGRRF
jgi:hypothetical protein